MFTIEFLKILYKNINRIRLLNIFTYIFYLFYFELYFYNELVSIGIGLYIIVFFILIFNLKNQKFFFISEYLSTFAVFNINCFIFGFSRKYINGSLIILFDFICLLVSDFIYPKIFMYTVVPIIETNEIITNREEIKLIVLEYKCENHIITEPDFSESNKNPNVEGICLEVRESISEPDFSLKNPNEVRDSAAEPDSVECENCICMICLSNMNNEIVGNNNCKHYFHYKCISEYITKCNLIKFVCPICRN